MIGAYLVTGIASMFVLLCAWIVMAFPLYHAGLICGEDVFGRPRTDVMLSGVVWLGLAPTLVALVLGWFVVEFLLPLL